MEPVAHDVAAIAWQLKPSTWWDIHGGRKPSLVSLRDCLMHWNLWCCFIMCVIWNTLKSVLIHSYFYKGKSWRCTAHKRCRPKVLVLLSDIEKMWTC
jgi:hypothetical protein